MRSMIHRCSIVFGIALGLSAAAAAAADKPSQEEVKKVLDFYHHGKGMGPVLVDARICRDIQREGDDKNECADDLTGRPVKKGDSVYFWMAFMSPVGEEPQTVMVQYEMNGVTRAVKNAQVTTGLRGRTWQKFTFDKTGSWKIKMVRDTASGPDVLGTRDVTVE